MRNWMIIACLIAALATQAQGAEFPQVRIETTAGDIVVELDDDRAPLTVENFLRYAANDFYTGTIFHRVVGNFVIQGGGYDVQRTKKETRAPIANESGNGLSNRRLTIAMARTGDPHSADSQFYINLQDNPDLDPKPTRWGYAVFGKVIDGDSVVDDIGFRPTERVGDFGNFPSAPVIIERMVIITPEAGG